MKKILLFTYSFPYGKGEQFLYDEIVHLSGHFTVAILPLVRETDIPRYDIPASVVILPPIIPGSGNPYLRTAIYGFLNTAPLPFAFSEFLGKKVYRSFYSMVIWMKASLMVRAVLRWLFCHAHRREELDADLCYFYWGTNSAYVIQFIDRYFARPVVCRFHGSDLYEGIRHDYIPYRPEILRKLTCALFVSGHGMKYLKSKYPDIPFRGEVHRLGILDHGCSSASADHIFRIVTCASLVGVKQTSLIADALADVPFQVRWDHFGDGPLKQDLLARTRKFNPGKVVFHFHGQVPNQELIRFYASNPVDLFINVSKSEGVPVSVMEALSFGIPVLATPVGGTPEIVDHSCGSIISGQPTPPVILRHIVGFRNRNDHELLRKNARTKFETLCMAEKNYSKLADLFHDLIQEAHVQKPVS